MKNKQSTKWQQLTGYVQELMKKHSVPGVSVGVYHSGKFISDGFGITSVENPLPVTNETLFQIGSITKTFNAVAIMRLVEMGRIDLDASVRAYCPDFRVSDEAASAAVTIRHLLSHTAGWLDYLNIDTGPGEDAIALYVERMADFEQISPVGYAFSYNSSGMVLLGRIIELITEKSYEEAISDLVLDPLSLENSTFRQSDVMVKRFSVSHIIEDGNPRVVNTWARRKATYPSGSLNSNVDELLKYAQFYLEDGRAGDGKQVLQAETIQRMQTPQKDIWRDREYVGLGWFIDIVETKKIVKHWGGIMGQISALYLVPDHDFAFAILTNADTGFQLANSTIDWCLRNFIGIEIEEPDQIDVPVEKKKELEGRYVLPRIIITDIRLDGERLLAKVKPTSGSPFEGSPPRQFELKFIEEDRLGVLDGKYKGLRAELIRDAGGAIKWLRIANWLRIREPS